MDAIFSVLGPSRGISMWKTLYLGISTLCVCDVNMNICMRITEKEWKFLT